MTANQENPKENNTWEKELDLLKSLALSCGLEQTLKWNQACFTHKANNIVLVSGFKAYCTLSFFKGALIKDELNLLVKPGEN